MELLKSDLYRASIEAACSDLNLRPLRHRTVLVSGASGMLGSCLIDLLGVWNQSCSDPCRIIAVSRNREQAEERFRSFWSNTWFTFLAQDVCAPVDGLSDPVDYVIHAASNADPVHVAGDPSGTLLANVLGTKNLLDYGRSHGMKRFLFVSSGEVYGQPNSNLDDFTESYCGPLDLSDPRSCYPSGKRAAEVLCQSHIHQYGVDAVIARPCHLFGPTMTNRDSRAVSEFLRQAAAGKEIEMKSAGLLERSHCYVVDAVKALLLILEQGECGQAYNIADRRYQMTIRDFAGQAAEAGCCHVACVRPSQLEAKGYSRISRAVLDASRLEALGWKPERCEISAVRKTVDILRQRGM